MAEKYTIKLTLTSSQEDAIKQLFEEKEWTYNGGKS
jgi:hypothetical protein